ncbi:MAG TPA: error-prone DNA polymerase [Polyangiaceae bacterium]|nr:error-prone DNA polymerase [Polyangiaceae bacterium]
MFAELLARTSFSFLRGASHPEEMVARAKELGLDAIALCDRDGLYGSVRALRAGQELEQRVIVGAELSVGQHPKQVEPPVLALLVETHQGYQNLCRLLTLAHEDCEKGTGALDVAWLARHHAGLVAVVPAPRCPGDSSTPPPQLLETVTEVFGARGYLAAHRHRDGFDRQRIEAVADWSARYGLAVVASARPQFHEPSRKALADVLHCIRLGTTLERAGTGLSPNAEAALGSESELLKRFADHPEWVERAGEVGQRLTFSLSELKYQFPCTLEPGESADQKLRRLTEQGLCERFPSGVTETLRAQIEKELAVIARLNVAPYFLSTQEVVQMARVRKILCQGRGSAANSAVCYALGITAVDPARSDLLFERFLSVERAEPPDIDVDFEHERREEVIQDIYARWGRDQAAMVSEVICYRGKSALREVGKAFSLPLETVDHLSASIGHWDDAEESEKHARNLGLDVEGKRLTQVIELSRLLGGFPRHLSIHVGGFVLSAEPLYSVAPIEPARMADRTVVPWDKDDIDTLGFFKVDVLGLGMLTAIRKILAMLHEDQALPVPQGAEPLPAEFDPLLAITRIPPEEREVYAMISQADTVGVFQIESRAQMSMLPRLRPKSFYDLVIEVAIVRPGPIQGGMVHPYLKRRNGEDPAVSAHPILEPILKRTLGVPLFQEQVMEIAIVGAGYTGGEADQLRRDMAAWKKSGRLLRHRERLLSGFEKRGIAREFGEALFEQIKGFGEYGFPESHAASFALLVYASSWQKLRFPAHFAAALINSQPMGFYTPSTIIQDAVRHGVTVRDVDVTCSNWDCTLERLVDERGKPLGDAATGSALRLGLRLVKGIGESVAKRIETVRKEWRFANMHDVVRRCELCKDDVEALAEAGAFESLVPARRSALWQARSPRAPGLFRERPVPEPAESLPPLRAGERLLLDYRHKGLSVGDHPIRYFRDKLRARQVVTAKELFDCHQGQRVEVAGVVTCRQQPATASGVVFITLEDETGFLNLVLWNRVYEEYRLPARHAAIMLARGSIERQGRPPGVRVDVPHDPLVDQVADVAPVIHVIVESLLRLDVPGRDIEKVSRDFH